MLRTPHIAKHYTARVQPARARLTDDSVLAKVISPNADPRLVFAFFIQLSALGVILADTHESRIQRVNARCRKAGHPEIGRVLAACARRDMAFQAVLGEDLGVLVPRWNRNFGPGLSASELSKAEPSAALRRFIDLYEQTLGGEEPCGLLALEYELDQLATVLGPALIDACMAALGRELCGELSLVESLGRSDQSAPALERVLSKRSELAEPFARLGSECLHTYIDVLVDCVERAESLTSMIEMRTAAQVH